VQVHDFGVASDGRPYYAMEYLEGETLGERLTRRGRLPWREVAELGIQACQALEAAHALGIVHRDIKPQNLFLTTDGTLKLLDFGITQSATESDRTSTESLSLIGTPEYMAPEQIGRHAVDARADVYGLGVVLYELLTGCLPHTGENTVALLDNKMHDKVKAPSQRVRKLRLPRYLDRVVLTALATETKDRYDSVVGLRQDLVWILGNKPQQAPSRRWLFGGMAALGAAAALALVGLDGWRDRIVVTAVPLRASAARVWSAAAQALPQLQAPPGAGPIASPAALAASAPVPSFDGSDDFTVAAPVEPIATAQLEDDTGSLERDLADDSDEPENPSETLEQATQPLPRVAPSLPQSSVVAPPAPKARPSTDIQRAVATVLAAETQAKLGTKTAAPKESAASKQTAVAKPTSKPSSSAKSTLASAKPAAKPASAAPVEAKATKTAKLDPELEHALSDAEDLIGSHELDALEAFRRLGRSYPREPKVLEGWSQIAATTKWWGESLKVAERWAAIDASAPAQLHLARTQKRLGQVERAIGTLKTLLAKHPSDREASSLLQMYGGASVALR
jgi:eukaryotic-like serine/threonine-protein kinase